MRMISVSAIVAVVALLSVPGSTWDRPPGSALVEEGLVSYGVTGLHDGRVGDDLMFALPAFDNASKQPLRIRSVRVKQVAHGLRVVDYRTLTYDQTGGMMLAWNRRGAPKDEAGFLSASRPGVFGLEVPATSIADRYAVVHVRIEAPTSGVTQGVEVVYEQDGRVYHQTMGGEWEVEMASDGGIRNRS
jgi:hypothetical protein